MHKHVHNLASEITRHYLKHGINDENMLIEKVRDELYEMDDEPDKLIFLTTVLEANETAYQKHLDECPNRTKCTTNKRHERVDYYLQKELRKLGIQNSSDHFTSIEKEELNSKLDEILSIIIASGQVLDENIQTLRNEIEELKSLYVLGKKNWKQQLAGKLTDMTFSGVISDLTAKPIINGILKPGVEFISDNLIG